MTTNTTYANMVQANETILEILISPLLITVISFFGFMFYIYCFVMQIDTIYMTVTPSVICFFATLLMFRPKIRFIRPVNHDGDSAMARLERRQRRVDTDSYYFGMIIFILAVIYLVFIEIVALI